MPDYTEIFCANIQRLQKERKLNKLTLATISGLSASIITDVMQGKANPSLKTMQSFSDGLGIPLPILLKPADSDEWKAIASAVQNIPTEEKPKSSVPDGYGMLKDVVLPQAKIEIIQDWVKQVKQTRRTLRKPRHSEQDNGNE